MQDWLKQAVKLSQKSQSPSIILPLSTSSKNSDVVLFNVYRSRAYGNEAFSEPEKVACLEGIGKSISIDRFLDKDGKVVQDSTINYFMKTKTYNNSNSSNTLLFEKLSNGELHQEFLPGTYYNDIDIEKGFYYQYWVSSVDEWGNESIWSRPVTISYAMDKYDAEVMNVRSRVVENIRINLSDYLPGFSDYRVLSKSRESEIKKLLTGEISLIIPTKEIDTSALTSLNSNPSSILPDGFVINENLSNSTESENNKGTPIFKPTGNISLKPNTYELATTGNLLLNKNAILKDISIGNKSISADRYSINKEKLKLNAYDEDVVTAIKDKSTFGLSVTNATVMQGVEIPEKISMEYMNMPDIHQISYLVAYEQEDFNPDGSLNVSWYAYQGDNLKEYALYRGVVRDKTVYDMKNMTKSEVLDSIYECDLVDTSKTNVYVDYPLTLRKNEVYVYIVVVVPEDPKIVAGYGHVDDVINDNAYGGWVKITWNIPSDRRQVKHYKIDSAKVDSFDDIDMEKLEWSLVERKCQYNYYFQPVEQMS